MASLKYQQPVFGHVSRRNQMIDTATRTTVWTIDPVHSAVEFSVKHMRIATVKGRFSDVTGQITIDNENIENSRVEVEIGAVSIDTRNEKRDAHLRSADFFDVEAFPTLTFKSSRVSQNGDDLVVTGDLAMHGVTRQVTLDAEFNGQAGNPTGHQIISYTAKTQLNRKDFGLNWNATLETGGVLVGDDIRINIEIEAYADV
jgi:polyisoprenoid-binding protein YceI